MQRDMSLMYKKESSTYIESQLGLAYSATQISFEGTSLERSSLLVSKKSLTSRG